ncbi:ABC transporter permease [Arthrobacter sp. NPDC080073]|uniref:ABC transporter permease n=1 Tax=Arthrobacter sp. NPDC080073 TaxID=3155919 RepID=UPI003426B848
MRSLVLTKFHFLSMWNWRSVYLGRFIEPIAFLILLGGGLSGSVATRAGSYPAFMLIGLICVVAFRAGTSTVSDVANDRKWGIFAIYVMQGGGIAGYLGSLVLFAVSVFLVQVLTLAGVASVLFGADVMQADQLFQLVALGIVIVVGWVGFGAAAGARIQSYSKRDLVITLTSLPVVLAAPLFYPLDSAPHYIKWLSAANPLTYQVAWLRAEGLEITRGYGFAAAWCLTGLLLAFFLLRAADRISNER